MSEHPDHISAWRVLGYAAFELSRYEEAASAYRLLSQIDRSAETYTSLARASRDDAERITALKSAIELNPASADAWMNLGYEFSHQETYAEALSAFEKAQGLAKPGTDRDIILFYIGMSLLGAGDASRAVENLSKAIRKDKVDAFREFFDVQIADACVGNEWSAFQIYEVSREVDAKAAENFLSMFARRQKAFELGVKPWEVGDEVIADAVAAYNRSFAGASVLQ